MKYFGLVPKIRYVQVTRQMWQSCPTRCLGIILLPFLLFFTAPAASFAKRFTSDTPDEVRQEILELEGLLALDYHIGIVEAPYSEKMINGLLSAIESQSYELKMYGLIYLTLVIKQLPIPPPVLTKTVQPVMNALLKKYENAKNEEANLAVRAKQVLWHIHIHEAPNDQARVDLLQKSLEDSQDAPDIFSDAVEYLVEMGTEEAKKVLEAKDLTGIDQQRNAARIEVLRHGIKRIALRLRLKKLEPAEQGKEIMALIAARKQIRQGLEEEQTVWLVRQLGAVQSSVAVQALRTIWLDESYDVAIRYEAQECLRRLGEPREREKMILFSD